MRGNNDNQLTMDSDEDAYVNHVFWFGCQENGGIAADTDIAIQFF